MFKSGLFMAWYTSSKAILTCTCTLDLFVCPYCLNFLSQFSPVTQRLKQIFTHLQTSCNVFVIVNVMFFLYFYPNRVCLGSQCSRVRQSQWWQVWSSSYTVIYIVNIKCSRNCAVYDWSVWVHYRCILQ